MIKIYLVRHGETKVNAKGFMHKTKDETVLSRVGEKQSELLAQEFERKGIDAIYSSSEKRSVQTARIIAEGLNIGVEIIQGFEERDWGKLSGKSWSEILEIIGRFKFKQRYEYIPPGGESWKEFEKRLLITLNKLLKINKDKNLVIVTHSGVIRTLMPTFLQKPKEESYKYDPDNASITEVEYEDKKWKVIRDNDIDHLKNSSEMEL